MLTFHLKIHLSSPSSIWRPILVRHHSATRPQLSAVAQCEELGKAWAGAVSPLTTQCPPYPCHHLAWTLLRGKGGEGIALQACPAPEQVCFPCEVYILSTAQPKLETTFFTATIWQVFNCLRAHCGACMPAVY